jgi:DNA-binding NarL/FixJ family response regulator
MAAPDPLRVFLVEDSPALRALLIDVVEQPGDAEVVGFADTESEAVRQLRAERPDVAIVDLNLKEGTGIGVIETLRDSGRDPGLTIAVLTNNASSSYEAACRMVGAHYFFDKATQMDELRGLLRYMRRS